jgi:hypothetical protein
MKNISQFRMISLFVLGLVVSLVSTVYAESFGVNEFQVVGQISGDGTRTDLFANFRPSEPGILWNCFESDPNQVFIEIKSSTPFVRNDQEIRFETEWGQISIPHQDLGGNGKVQAQLIETAQSLVCYPN